VAPAPRSDSPDSPAPAEAAQLDDVAAAQLEALDVLDDDAEDIVEDATSDDEVPAADPVDGADPGGSRGSRPTRTVAADAALLDPLTAPLSLLTMERPGMPEPLLADELLGEPTATPPAPSSRIVLDPLWDTVPGPEPEEPDLFRVPALDLQPVVRLGRFTAAGVIAVSVLAVAIPVVSFVFASLGVAEEASLALAGAAAVALVVSTALFLTWVGRARGNVERISAVAQRWSGRMAVVGWLIPVAGLFVGWQVLRDLWVGSDPRTRSNVGGRTPEPLLVTSWLAGLAVSSVVSLAGRFVLGGSPLVDAVAGIAVALSGACLVATVMRISRWQQQ